MPFFLSFFSAKMCENVLFLLRKLILDAFGESTSINRRFENEESLIPLGFCFLQQGNRKAKKKVLFWSILVKMAQTSNHH